MSFFTQIVLWLYDHEVSVCLFVELPQCACLFLFRKLNLNKWLSLGDALFTLNNLNILDVCKMGSPNKNVFGLCLISFRQMCCRPAVILVQESVTNCKLVGHTRWSMCNPLWFLASYTLLLWISLQPSEFSMTFTFRSLPKVRISFPCAAATMLLTWW